MNSDLESGTEVARRGRRPSKYRPIPHFSILL
jgi:hypothetical protein